MKPLYTYLDTTRSLTGSTARNMVPLLDATKNGADGRPERVAERSRVARCSRSSGAFALYGDREDALYDYAATRSRSRATRATAACPTRASSPRTSPIPDLVHAVGQILADKDSDAILLSLIDSVENHEDVVARLMGAALTLKDIADKHDALAAGGTEKAATMPYATPIWDEIAAVVARITAKPGLTKHLLEGLADDTVVTPIGGSQRPRRHALALHDLPRRDGLRPVTTSTGPVVNVTDGAPSTADMHNAGRSQVAAVGQEPRRRSSAPLQIIHDAKDVQGLQPAGRQRLRRSSAGSGSTGPSSAATTTSASSSSSTTSPASTSTACSTRTTRSARSSTSRAAR